MAMRPQHMHDGGIVERRLRPIYDWLDNGYNKKALQEAEKVLKKSPSLQAARALKALALYRLGKGPEAHAVLDALAEEKPSDDATLQAMTITYRESQQLNKVCSLYEAAVKAEPTSEELHSHLFMSYVRIGDYKSQQRAAMALYKFAPKNPYYFWGVMSIVLQAKSSEDSTKRNILLALAQRMIDNFISENKMEAEQEARLYIMILDLQDKWRDILKFIESPLYSQLVPGSIAQACIPYLKKLGQWKCLNVICKQLLWDNQDRWDYYLPYFDSVFHLMNGNDENENSDADNTAEKCHEFICQLVESVGSGRALRGPYLARLELWKRLAVDGDPTALLGSSLALCVQYLRVFGHKPCVVPDLRPYLAMIPKEEREENCRDFLTCLGFDEDSAPETADDIQRHISCLSLWRLSAAPLGAAEALALADKLRDHYSRCLREGRITSTATEFCPADAYAVLAAHHYFYAAMQLEDSGPVLDALALLEVAHQHSPANFHVKLLLVKLYHVLGDGTSADEIYRKVEVKHIQLLSLGWWHAERLAPELAAPRADELAADTAAFHRHHSKDSVEHITYAYKFGTFEKLNELYAWGSRLEACACAALAARDHFLRRLLAAAPALAALPPRLPAEPTDNRDLNVIVNFEPPEDQDPDLKARSFEQNVAYLRLKDALVSSVELCLKLSCNPTADEKREHHDQLNACVEAFNLAMDKCRHLYTQKERISISAPFPSRIIAFVNSPVPYRELYCSTFKMCGALLSGAAGAAHAAAERALALLPTAHKLLVEQLKLEGDPLWRKRERLEILSNYLEFMAVVMTTVQICYENVAPTNVKKSKKKTSQSPDEMRTMELLNRLNETLQTSVASLDPIFDEFPKHNGENMKHHNIDPNYTKNIVKDKSLDHVRSSLSSKCKELKSLLQ